MREIKFRGKRLSDGKWIHGNYASVMFTDEDNDTINGYPVDSSTVGQFTGMTDRDGRDIYEGDICSIQDSEEAVVEWSEYGLALMTPYSDVNYRRKQFDFSKGNRIKVVGTVHDRNKYLEGKK
ncbi:MAG: YopX family protein [Bacteroides sp.]|nr:YopX family protein [Bacteroides sp.]